MDLTKGLRFYSVLNVCVSLKFCLNVLVNRYPGDYLTFCPWKQAGEGGKGDKHFTQALNDQDMPLRLEVSSESLSELLKQRSAIFVLLSLSVSSNNRN